ncbi:hypothetical protein [Arachnia propionica]|uniref:Uncharacterized protein n=1 Tax=Arachnia propionica TaxID=1750 RepID=A0A3P1WVG2_9ACTN|nr:hypothetical protein [Arachnia propionica]RRD49767.1 hypothetical protein EII35_07105 [Arachnia propionica]
MQRKVVAATMVVLFGLLGFMAAMVADFHDRSWPQSLGVEAQITVDFSQTGIAADAGRELLRRTGEEYHLGLYKVAPDLEDTGREVFVAINGQSLRSVEWFGEQRDSEVVAPERLANSKPDGAYLVVDPARLGEAVSALRAEGIGVTVTEASVLDTVRSLVSASQSGFMAPVAAAALLVAALTVFWLAARARSRALRVLAGGSPWRIQAQDIGGYLLYLLGSAVLVGVLCCGLVGLSRGWLHVPLFAQAMVSFEIIAFVLCGVVILLLSVVAWPSAALFATRKPAVTMLQRPARIVQALTLFALVASAGPAWLAVQETEQTAQQLATWYEFSDQVMLGFEVGPDHLDVVANRVQQAVSRAESEGQVVMSYTIKESDWSADFGPYSAISIVNSGWMNLVSTSVGKDALVPVSMEQEWPVIQRGLGESWEIWSRGTRSEEEVLADLRLHVPAKGVAYPVADGGRPGQLSFLTDVLVIEAPTVQAVFNPSNLVSLASTGNVLLTGVAETNDLLHEAGLDEAGLAELGVEGAILPLYAAEQGILRAQFAAHLARILSVAVVAMTAAFLVAAGVNAVIAALLNTRRDFPMRLSGATWEQVTRPRARRELILGAVVVAVALFLQLQTPAALLATAVAGIVGLAVLYLAHAAAAATIFARITHRKL